MKTMKPHLFLKQLLFSEFLLLSLNTGLICALMIIDENAPEILFSKFQNETIALAKHPVNISKAFGNLFRWNGSWFCYEEKSWNENHKKL